MTELVTATDNLIGNFCFDSWGSYFWRSFERERERHENHIFHAEEHIYNLQILFSELISLSENPLLALSATFRTERKSLSD